HTIYSSFFGSLALGLLSHYMARKQKEPAIIFMVTGIIPLVVKGKFTTPFTSFNLIYLQYFVYLVQVLLLNTFLYMMTL
ncbi:threonine/serine exporter family protein, partial [Staphylococcus aureus]|uniref:threonine/serine exporter family protein n=1 Tax=Staphylococcus aureus TaxID=1280 RepID=UPI001E5F8020